VKIFLIAAITALVAVGCNNPNPDSKPMEPAKPAEAKPGTELPRPPVAAVPAEAKADDDLPTQEDFADEAEKDISAANVESEVDKLEKEIGE
jgi:hypothetical protein